MLSTLRIFGVYCQLGLLAELQYRANFFVQLFQSLVNLGTTLVGLEVVLSHTHRLGGWTAPQLLAVLGVFYLMGGIIWLVIQPSMQRLMEDVRLGTLDYTLTKPEDSQILVSVSQVQVWKLVDLAVGVVVLSVASTHVRAEIGPIGALDFAVALVAGAAIVYSFWLMLATCSFWFIRITNILVIFQSMYQAGRWPVSIYPPWLRGTLTFLVPIAFAITVPAQALVGRLNGSTLMGAVALAAALLTLSRWFWRTGVRHYSGASA